ncbi:GAF domain-containing protein [Alloalcanivorax mobilis]|uniref:GAF domain-containing protein n=1 Tax=Alloalcanivorax mobilis TaxID=2019569 RepID=UPI000B5B1BE9|nr:GAF domain-containing protein [Alloalcanivorax mobilis]ASK33984.1 histidine kinase [Alcanivorax sp. N3-2A]|tara:strand:- start:19234 stop:20448 length:1215 start_codon:yes stop_codon:yes gene_type:complete
MSGTKSLPSLDSRQERALKQSLNTLWVRFPGSLEDTYTEHAERRAKKLIKRSIYVLVSLFLLVAVPVSIFNQEHNLALWQSFGVYPIAASLGLLLLAIKVPRLDRWVTTLIGLALMTSLAGTLMGAIYLEGTFLGQVAAFETVYVLIIGFSILRLPPTRTLFWCLGSLILALLTAMVAGWSVSPAALLLFYGFPLMVCALNGYMLDASARTSYANTLLLNRESGRLRQWRDNADRETRRQRMLNEFMAHIAGNPTVAVLLDQTLAFLIAETPAVAGAAYRLDDGLLHQEAARGLNQQARQRDNVAIEGLLGGALEGGRGVTVRHDVPAGYLDLETGQSRVRPAQLLMLPLWHGDQALGVIELAALEPFGDDMRTRVESLGAPLAYALTAAIGREAFIRRHRDAG